MTDRSDEASDEIDRQALVKLRDSLDSGTYEKRVLRWAISRLDSLEAKLKEVQTLCKITMRAASTKE